MTRRRTRGQHTHQPLRLAVEILEARTLLSAAVTPTAEHSPGLEYHVEGTNWIDFDSRGHKKHIDHVTWDTDPTADGTIEVIVLVHDHGNLNADKLAGKTFAIKYYYMAETSIMDGETGELKDAIRTVLISPNNEVAAFVSEGVAKAVALMARRFGTKPFNPPLVVEVRVTKTGSNRRFLSLVPAGVATK